MEKFAIDLDKVLDDFEFNEDCAEQIASVSTSTTDASAIDNCTTKPLKIHNYLAISPKEINKVLDVPRDTQQVDNTSTQTLDEKSIASKTIYHEECVNEGEDKNFSNKSYTYESMNENKIEQKLCVYPPDDFGEMPLTTYNDISCNVLQKIEQNESNNLKDDNRYDKKLNQSNIKPSISNVFNSLNEYINAPTGSLEYVCSALDKQVNLSENTPVNKIPDEEVTLSKSIAVNECPALNEEEIGGITNVNVNDYENISSANLDTFVELETDNKQCETIQNNTLQHSILTQLEKNSNEDIVSSVNTLHTKYECSDTEVSDNQADVNQHTTNDTDIIEKISRKKLNQSEANSLNPTYKGVCIEKKENVEEDKLELDINETMTNNDNHDKDVETIKNCDILFVHIPDTVDTSDNFSEEELNQYLLELEEEEERSKKEDTPSLKTQDELIHSEANQYHRGEAVNEAPIFERIMIGELPKISEEEYQEKVKKYPVIDYNTVAQHNDNVTNSFEETNNLQEFSDTIKVISSEKISELTDTEANDLEKEKNDGNIIMISKQNVVAQENILEVAPNMVIQEKTTSQPENVIEQCNHNVNMTQKVQQNILMDMPSQENKILPTDLLENQCRNVSVNCDDSENKENILKLHDNKKQHSKNYKTEILPKINDLCITSHTNENNQEFEKPARPQTLDIVSTHNRNDSRILESSSTTPGEPEHSETGGVADEDRGASSDVSDNSLIECNTILGKQPPFWIPDSDASSCMLCDVRFTVLKRRHHCRACGKVLCHKCCSMKYRLEYQGNIDSRVCVPCYHLLTKAESEQGIGDWPTGYSLYAGCSDINSPQGRQPNPNNPMEYCSTIPPLQQLAGGLPPPPTVMVPVGVLKREGSKHRTEGSKSVMFSDGIRPGCDLTELDTCWDLRPPYRKQGNKRIFSSGSTLTDTPVRRQSHPPLDSVTNSHIPYDPNLSPPTVTIHKGQITYHPSIDEAVLYKTLKNECEPPVMFAINRNLFAYVKITHLKCCVNKVCWNITSRGLACVGQDEIILLVETLPDETRVPKDLLIYINQLYLEAIKGNTMTELSFSVYQGGNLLGSREHTGFLFIRQTLQCLQKIILPPAPFLIGLLVHRWETPWAKVFPLRLLLRLGAEYRYYPCPLVSVRFRDALYYEIGHTVMKVLADFRNYGYTLPGVRGLTIHLKNRTTDVMFPRNRYDQVIKGLHNSNDHVLAYASNFSISADSHLVCIQTNTGDESNYQTQAINIHNKPRTVTGASFIVINGALKSSMGLSAKSSIVEDGLMVEIMPEKMEALKAALKNMQDFSIGCGRQGASEPDETVNIKWVDNDVLFNLGVKSPIDGQLMDGIPSIRVHNGTDYKGATRFIRWTEVFIIKSDDHSNGVSDPVDINKLSGNIAKATCAALVKLLDLLATAGLTKLGVRATIHPDNVGYEAGSESTKLPPIYMNSLDNELIQVLHKAAQSSQDAHTVLELIFYVLDD